MTQLVQTVSEYTINYTYESIKQIRRAVASDFVANLSGSLLSFATGLYILKVTNSSMYFAVTLFIGPLIGILFAPIIGYISDHYDNKKVMVISQSITAFIVLISAIIFPLFNNDTLIVILTVVSVTQLNARIMNITYKSSVSQMVSETFIQKINSLEQSSASLANILSPVISGILFNSVPLQTFLYIETLAELIVVLIVYKMNFHLIAIDENDESRLEKETVFTSLKNGFKYINKNRVILSLIITFSFFNFFTAMYNLGFPYIIIHILHLSTFQYSLTESIYSLGLVITGIIISSFSVNKNKLLQLSSNTLVFFSIPILLILIPLNINLNSWSSTVIFFMIYLITAALLNLINVIVMTYIQQSIPYTYQGRIFTLLTTGATSLQPLGYLIYGLMFQYISSTIIVLITSLGFLLLGLISLLTYKKK